MKNNRHQRIIDLLRTHETLRISELAEECKVSQVTIRKDISTLEKASLITKFHGKVALSVISSLPYIFRTGLNQAEKIAIARVAVSLISATDTIMLDAGTTTMCIARELANKPTAYVITNSIPIAAELGKTNHYLSLCGGDLLNRTMCLVGPDAEQYFHHVETQKLFVGTTGIRENFVLTTGLRQESSVKEAMVHAAKEVILVADSSKFRTSAIFGFAEGKEIHCIITTHPEPPPPIMKLIEEYGIRLIYAD